MVRTYLHIALRNLWVRKLKAFLTMLGIIIGVAAVVVIFSLSEGAQYMVLDQIRGYGSNVIIVMPGKSDDSGPPAEAQGIIVTTLTYKDAQDIAITSKVPSVTAVAPYARGIASMRYQRHTVDSTFIGTSAGLQTVEGFSLQAGRFFTEEDERLFRNVVVLGAGVHEKLFPGNEMAIGSYITIKNERFQVIGVVEERGVQFFQNQDDQVFVPVTTAQRKLLGTTHLVSIRTRVENPEHIARTIEDIQRVLRVNHRIGNPEDDDFSVRSSKQALETLELVLNIVTWFLSFVSGISLVVGGIGIMNIMLMTVKERIKEIGLRKAIGAPNRAILQQFLIESAVLCTLGGVLGVGVGAGVSWMISVIAQWQGYSWIFVLPLQGVLLAVGVACGVGVVFGYYPARKAAYTDPISALRTE